MIRRSSLYRDFVLISISLTLITVVISFWFTWQVYSDQSEDIKNLLDSVSQRIERVLIDDLDYTSYQMEYISNQIKNKPTSKDEIYKILASFRGNHKVNVAFSWNMFSWVNKDGFLTVDGNVGIISKPPNMLNRDYLPCTIKHPGKLCLGSQPVYGAASKQWIIPAGMGVADNNGQYLGSIIFGFDMNSLIFKIEQTIANENISFILINNNNIIAESANNKDINSNLDILSLFKQRYDSTKPTAFLQTQPLFNKNKNYVYYNVLERYMELEKYPFHAIIVSYDKNLSYKQFWQIWSIRMLEFMIFFIGSLLILGLIYKRIVNPILNLASIANEISNGNENISFHGNYAQEILILETQLKKVLNYISAEKKIQQELATKTFQLEEVNKQVNILNHNLEQNVNERTFQLQAALAAKSDFLNKMSIEIRSPVHTVINFAKSLVYDWSKISEEKRYQYAENIYRNCSRLLGLMNNLLDLSKLESGKMSFSMLENDLISITVHIIEEIKNSNKNSQITFQVDCEEAKCYCDKELITQVIRNLLVNSIKFSNNDIIIVKIKKENLLNEKNETIKGIKFSVEDKGIGIPKGEETEIFSKFTQSSKTKTYENGSGLGLAICLEIITAHHGKIWAENNNDIGSTVSFIIPAL
ncbi:MAG: ATP-binding protein [Alphaproteobacteria bacterium]